MRKLFCFLVFLWAFQAQAQIPATANLTASDAGTCATANACLVVKINTGQASSVVQLTGTFSATLQFEANGAPGTGGAWVAVNAVPVGGTTAVTSATSAGAWRIAVAGLAQVRVRCSTFSSGTVVTTIGSSTGSSAVNSSGGGGGAVSSVFTRTGAVTAAANDYTLDQIGDPAAAKTFALGTNNPLKVSSAGLFTDTQQNEYLLSSLNSCDPGTIFTGVIAPNGHFGTDALAGCVSIPSSAVSNAFESGVAGYAINNNACTTCSPVNSVAAGVGVSGIGLAAANNAGAWGGNFVASDKASQTGNGLQGIEVDTVSSSTSTTGYGVHVIPFGSAQPSGEYDAILIGSGGATAQYNEGLKVQTGSVVNGNSGVDLQPAASGTGTNSYNISMFAKEGGGQLDQYYLQAKGDSNLALQIGLVGASNFTSNWKFSGVTGFGGNSTLGLGGPLKFPIFTVSTLPSATTAGAGAMVTVSDATTFTVGTCTGGGSDYMIAISNGTTWSCH